MPRDSGSLTTGSEALPFTAWEDIHSTTEPRDFVEGLLLAESMSVLYGEPGSGKSFFAADIALHVAAGRKWRDRQVEQGGVLYVALEGPSGFRSRLCAARSECDFPSDMPFAFVSVPINMLDPDADVQRIIATVHAVSERFGLPTSMIVIDTLARCLAGGNENSSEAMGAFVMNCDLIRAATNAHVMVVHHSGKDAGKGARGHSSLKGAVDTEIELTRDGLFRVATVVKQRDLPEGDRFPFTLRVFEIGVDRRGRPVTTRVVEHDDSNTLPSRQSTRAKSEAETNRELVFRAISDMMAAPAASTLIAPVAGMPPVATITRESLRIHLRGCGFFECHGNGNLTTRDRDTLRKTLNALRAHGKIGMTDRLVWLI